MFWQKHKEDEKGRKGKKADKLLNSESELWIMLLEKVQVMMKWMFATRMIQILRLLRNHCNSQMRPVLLS